MIPSRLIHESKHRIERIQGWRCSRRGSGATIPLPNFSHQWLCTKQMACHRCTESISDQNQHANLYSKPMATVGHEMAPSKPAGSLSSASMQSVAQRAHNFASIWSGWQQWRLTHKLKRAILRQSSNWWQGWIEWVKTTCNNSSVAVEIYNSSATSVNSKRVTEILKWFSK